MDSDTARMLRVLEQRIARLETKPAPLYQTGSFVPTLVGSGVAGTFTYGAATLIEWIVLANYAFFNGRIVITVITVAPTLNMTINGFPYAGVSDATMGIAGGAHFFGWGGITMPAGFTQVGGQMSNTLTTMAILREGSAKAPTVVQGADIALVAGVLDFRFQGAYRIR